MNRKTADFLETRSGLDEIEMSLVGDNVLEAWIECACPLDNTNGSLSDAVGPNPVLETLVFLVHNKQESWGEEKVSHSSRVLASGWRFVDGYLNPDFEQASSVAYPDCQFRIQRVAFEFVTGR